METDQAATLISEANINELINTYAKAIRSNPVPFVNNVRAELTYAPNSQNYYIYQNHRENQLNLNSDYYKQRQDYNNQLTNHERINQNVKRKKAEISDNISCNISNTTIEKPDQLDSHRKNQSSPKVADKSLSTSRNHQTRTSKFKSLSTNPSETMKPFKPYAKLKDEIAKFFTDISILSTYIDRDDHLIIKTNSSDNQKAIEATNLSTAFAAGLQLIKPQHKFYFAIHNVDLETDLDDSRTKKFLEDEFKVTETKRMTKKSDPSVKFKTIKAMTTDQDVFNKIINDGKIKLFYSNLRISKWNFNDGPNQCFKCLSFGHSHASCTGTQACLRCGEAHAKSDCQLPKDTKAEDFTCINCKKNKLDHKHSAVSRECPAIIANMAKKVSATAKFTRIFSTALTNGSDKPIQNNLDLAKINTAIATNTTNVVLLIVEMFKNLSRVQEDLDTHNPVYTQELISHYLSNVVAERTNAAITEINKDEQKQNDHE